MVKVDNCNKCVHKQICAIKPTYSEYTGTIKDVDFIGKMVNITVSCNHYKEDTQKYKRAVTNDGKEELV